MHRILVADDEEDLVRMVGGALTREGYDVVSAEDGEKALTRVREDAPDLVILDIGMPKLSGLEVCRALRRERKTSTLPIIFLTARTSEVDRIVALELGADDFVSKPFSPRELVLRVRAILRAIRDPQRAADLLRVGEISLNRDRHEVEVAGGRCEVTAVEFKLLTALMLRPGEVLSREALLNIVWGKDKRIELRTIDTQIRRLRSHLGRAGDQIQTVRTFGYRLVEGTGRRTPPLMAKRRM